MHRKHYWTSPWRPGTRLRAKPRSAVDAAFKALFPWENRVDYPGLYRGTLQLLSNRIALHTLKNWLAGRRRAPQWARDMLKAELEKRASDIAKAIAALEKENGPD